jgi:putative copper resistance protein D
VIALLARWVHLAASVLLVGGATMLLLAGPSDRATARRWEAFVVRAGRWLVVLALFTGVIAVAGQTAALEGRAAAWLDGSAIARMLLNTQAGAVWLVRGGLLLVLGAFLAVRMNLTDRTDWRAARAEGALLGLGALGLIAAAGHAAAVEPDTAAALAIDVMHLLAAGVWVGGLPALALLLSLAGREDGADARPHAVLATRRFSTAALALVVVLAVSGIWNTWAQVGSVAGLLGTLHGRLLLGKLALFVILIALAAGSRRLVPALSGEAAAIGRPAMRRLGRFVTAEAVLAALVLGLVAVMSVTPPARHTVPVWPLRFRLSYGALEAAPEMKSVVLVGSQVAVLGLVALLASLSLRRLRLPILAGGVVVLLAGLGIALPPLVTDAYPTTYRRPDVPYHAASIAGGKSLFAQHCVACHGPRGGGDGPAAGALNPPPPDLRAHHVALHTAGDIFWWIGHGLRTMPAFGDRLSSDERWDLVNFLRALSAAETARLLGPAVAPEPLWIVAPDFTFAVGPTPARSLKEYRGRKTVLLVLYTLPASAERLTELAQRYALLSTLGLEIVAVPTDAAPDALRRLGEARVFYPVVTDGAPDILDTYRLFSAASHVEFLIDRQGYLRALAAGSGTALRNTEILLADLQRLNAEKALPPPAEHVH